MSRVQPGESGVLSPVLAPIMGHLGSQASQCLSFFIVKAGLGQTLPKVPEAPTLGTSLLAPVNAGRPSCTLLASGTLRASPSPDCLRLRVLSPQGCLTKNHTRPPALASVLSG